MAASGEAHHIRSYCFDLLYFRYWVYLNSVGNTQPGASSSKPYTAAGYSLAVILDSGTTPSYIPQNLFNLILADFPGAVLQSSGVYTVPCSYATQSGTMDFGFGNVIINVPYSQFVWQPVAGTCYLGVIPMSSSITIPILGDTFLRGTYGESKEQWQNQQITDRVQVVYDQDNVSVYLANYVNCGTSVVAVPAGNGAASAFKGQCPSPSTTTSSSTSTSSSTTSSSSTSSTSSSSSQSSTSSSVSSTTFSSTSSSSQSSSTSQSSSSLSVSSQPPYPLPTNGCHQNNCLRALKNQHHASSAYMYCNTFMATSVPTASTSGVPTYLNNCGPTSIISAISSACPCFLATYKPSMTLTTSTSVKPLLPTQGCHQNNCLRALENQVHAMSAYAFCKSFLGTTVPTASTAGIPNYLANCGPTATVSALSSACPCFLATYMPAATTV
jgi:Eukaryotic aspartyl protease